MPRNDKHSCYVDNRRHLHSKCKRDFSTTLRFGQNGKTDCFVPRYDNNVA